MTDSRKPGAHISFRATLGIVVGVVILGGIILLTRTREHPSAEDPGANRAKERMKRRHDARLAEMAIQKEETRERAKTRRTPAALDSPHVSEDKKKEMAVLVERAEEAKEKFYGLLEENERFRARERAEQERINRALAEKGKKQEKEKSKIRLVAEVGKRKLLPFQPLPVRLRIINEGPETAALHTVLTPDLSGILVAARWPGEKSFKTIRMWRHTGTPPPRGDKTSVKGLKQVSLSTELFLGLGFDHDTQGFRPGEYQIRLQLRSTDSEKDPPDPFGFSVHVVSPAGPDAEILRSLLASDQVGYLAGPHAHQVARVNNLSARLASVEKIIEENPTSPYVEDLRLGYLAVALRTWPMIAKEEKTEAGIFRRMNLVAQGVNSFQKPSSWIRAESYLLLSGQAENIGRPGEAVSYLNQFMKLCPDDVRVDLLRKDIDRLLGRR